ncbi:MAG: nitroreductase family protein [Acidimicrobiia bacterium]|nr:nitroreductase family protein [Acidimicrobiia bacterium]
MGPGGRDRSFYDAPHVAFFSLAATMGLVNAVDVGIFAQTVMLLMAERGVATCPQGSLAAYPDPVHRVASIPEGNAIVCGMSFGYENRDARINQLPRCESGLPIGA